MNELPESAVTQDFHRFSVCFLHCLPGFVKCFKEQKKMRKIERQRALAKSQKKET